MQALISPNEIVYSFDGTLLGERVAEVSSNSFPVALPLFWIECDSSIVASQVYYDPNENIIKPIPIDENAAILAAELAAINAAQEIVEV